MSFYTKCDSDLCYNKTRTAPPPRDWFLVTRMRDTAETSEHLHFCSLGCLSYWATKQHNEEEARDANH